MIRYPRGQDEPILRFPALKPRKKSKIVWGGPTHSEFFFKNFSHWVSKAVEDSPNKNISMLCMQELFLGGWIYWNIVSDVYILTKGKSVNAERNENVQLTHTQVFCGRLCVVRITVTKNKLYWCHGYLLVQNAECRPYTKCRLGTKCGLQTAEWIQNADRECKVFFRLVCDNVSSYNLPSVTQSLFHDQLSRLFALLWNITGPFFRSKSFLI